MLLAIALPLLVCILYVIRRLIYNLRFGRRRRRTRRKLEDGNDRSQKPITIFTNISRSGTPSVDYRHSRLSISETIDVRKAINGSKQLPSDALIKKRKDLPAPPDSFNYFPQPSAEVPSSTVQNRSTIRSLPLATPIERRGNSVRASPSLSSKSNTMQMGQPQILFDQAAGQSRVSSPSISASRRKRPAHSASDLYKTPRISKTQRYDVSNTNHHDSARKRMRVSEKRSPDEFDLAQQIRHGAASCSERATNSDISDTEMQDELTIEMPPESLLDSAVENAGDHAPTPPTFEFHDAGKIFDESEPDLPHSDFFNNNRRISKIYPKRHMISDDTIFDDEEVRLKFQRNDKEVLDILQSYAS